jgi:putative membrane protein
MQALIEKNDKVAYPFIGVFSLVVFLVVVSLGKFKLLNLELGFDPHIFAKINAIINTTVSLTLLLGLYFVKQKQYENHKRVMMGAMVLSFLFLVSYILHHLLTVDTHFGGEGAIRYFYFPLLISHIVLAATILPFILLTTYRALTGDFSAHKKIARITYPIWLYVSISGVLVYLLISPYSSSL